MSSEEDPSTQEELLESDEDLPKPKKITFIVKKQSKLPSAATNKKKSFPEKESKVLKNAKEPIEKEDEEDEDDEDDDYEVGASDEEKVAPDEEKVAPDVEGTNNSLILASGAITQAIHSVLKQVHPNIGITNKAMAIIRDFICDMFGKVCLEAENLARMNNRKTITSREIQTAIRLILPGELAKHAVSEGTKALTKYNACFDEETSQKTTSDFSQATAAGLVFPVSVIHQLIKDHWLGQVGTGAAVYLASVLEYLSAEVLELAGNAGKDAKSIRIIPRHIMLAIRCDAELEELCRWCTIPSCGILPHIAAVLLPTRFVDQPDEVIESLSSQIY